MITLETEITYLPGVGPNRAAILGKEISITTIGDLLTYYPYKYVDRTRIYRIADIDGNMPYVQIAGKILSFESFGEGRNRRLVAHFSDGSGVADLVWFNGIKYITQTLSTGKAYVVLGKPQVFGGRINITHPDIEDAPAQLVTIQAPTTRSLFGDDGDTPQSSQRTVANSMGKFHPHYHTTERMKKAFINSAAIARLTSTLFHQFPTPFPETLPSYLVSHHNLMSYDEAVRNIHFPTSADALRRAQARLKFEELFYVQLGILRYAHKRMQHYRGYIFPRVADIFNTFYSQHLPFQLTGAQKRVIREVRDDMRSGRQMNRLVQGDVGSGKTLVALMCALIAIDNGFQVCLMAPTEILAAQHLETLTNFLGNMPVNVSLLTGSVKGKRRKETLQGIADGTVNILVGTHAVIEDNVTFSRLGLVIIDEQHRFGVAQRAKLWMKTGVNDNATQLYPHVLVMTATPIPRTLAMTLYGDLDVSVIDELPPGRKPIRTVHQFDTHRQRLYQMMRHELQLGRQIYIVYPLIKETEKMDLKDLEQGFEEISAAFPEYKVSKVHGKLKPSEKDEEMTRFASHETHILVATTVIEVGVNVPNASMMIIENAERFGLSQLHQLRGRVGRGADQSYCILVTRVELSSDTRKRIQIMVDSTDGFEIAEADLKLRGPGDLEGTQQSGMAFDLKIANLALDGQILQYARNAAQAVIDQDPDETNPANALLWTRLHQLRKDDINWGAIS